VIIVVEGIKRSRREEVDWGQLKWAVDKSGQFEGKPYSSTSDKSKKVAYASWTRGQLVTAKAESGPRGCNQTRPRATGAQLGLAIQQTLSSTVQ
jgi:hypothetical protein